MCSKSVPEAHGPAARPRPAGPWSLAARLTAWYAASAFVLILAATGFLYWVLATSLDREDDQFLADEVSILRAILSDRPQDAAALRQEVEWEWAVRHPARVFVRILDEDGHPILETPGLRELLSPEALPGPVAADLEPGRGFEIRSGEGRVFRALAARAHVGRSGRDTRVIQVVLDRAQEVDLLAGYRERLWMVLGIALVVCALAGHGIARGGIRPIEEIAATARRIGSATLHERIATAGLPAELSSLAGTFNDMLDRLEESFARLARFSADIAHELRTPVNNLRGEAEVALGRSRSPEEYREVLGSCLEECARLSRLIDALLFLARAESPETHIGRERVDVGRELSRVQEFYEPAAAEAGVALTVAASDGVTADLDRTLFQRAIGNLVANALAHTPRGGAVTLSAATDDNAVRVEVSDNGCGIPRDHVPHVFDRFYRVDRARSTDSGGVGLGLAIVKSIATLHGGSAEILSVVGRGTRVTLTFPGGR